MSDGTRPQLPDREAERQRRLRAAVVTFFVVLVVGTVIAVLNPPRDWYSGEIDSSVYLIPIVAACGAAIAVNKGGGKGLLIGILASVLTLGLTCTVALNNMEW